MSTLIVKILDDRDEGPVMRLLSELVKQHAVEVSTEDSSLMPGSPMTIDQLNALIQQAEQSPRLSVEEVKARLGL